MTDSKSDTDNAWTYLFIAWATALAATLAALFIGEVMGQAPCNLCWFQRAFMFPLVVVLAIASYRSDYAVAIYAIPLAGAGWLLAGVHSLLYAGIIPEAIEPCGKGPSCSSADMTIFGNVPLPVLSLAAFTIIIASLFGARRSATS